MAQHKSAEKRHRQSVKRTARNTAIKSRMRKAVKAARAAMTSNASDKDALLKAAIAQVYRTASKGVVKRATASRYVSRLMLQSAR